MLKRLKNKRNNVVSRLVGVRCYYLGNQLIVSKFVMLGTKLLVFKYHWVSGVL